MDAVDVVAVGEVLEVVSIHMWEEVMVEVMEMVDMDAAMAVVVDVEAVDAVVVDVAVVDVAVDANQNLSLHGTM